MSVCVFSLNIYIYIVVSGFAFCYLKICVSVCLSAFPFKHNSPLQKMML